MALPVRPGPSRRRGPSVQRASSLISRVRLGAATVLLLTAASLHSLTTSPVFTLDPATITIEGLHRTDPATARAALGVADGANLFRLRTSDIEGSLVGLPTIRRAHVRAYLPDALAVTVEERSPILAWSRGGTPLLADVDGVLFAPATPDDALPAIDDRRSGDPPLGIGDVLPAADFEVARSLGAVQPADLGSAATALSVSVEDGDGWVVESTVGWRAVFGHYTVELRPPSDIPAQVACLRGLLASREATVESVTLALSADGCGTYRDRGEPSPSLEPDRGGGSPTRRP